MCQGRAVELAEFGELRFVVDGKDVAVNGIKARSVLAALALRQGSEVTSDRLVDLVWPLPDQPATARQSLANIVRRTRQLISPDVIMTSGETYRLSPDVVSHRQRFLAGPAQARQLLRDHHPEQAADHARRLQSLWRGQPWAGLDDLAPVIADRVVLESCRLEVDEVLAHSATATGDLRSALAAWLRLIDASPFNEAWWCSAAHIQAQLGDRVEGLRLLRRARAALDQAGLLCGPRLEALEQRLLGNGSATGTHPTDPAPGTDRQLVDRHGTPSLLVAEELRFVGRADELVRLTRRRTAPDPTAPRISFIAGAAGAGKSRLMVEAARRCTGHVVLSGRCEVGMGLSLGPFRQILNDYAHTVSAAQRRSEAGPFGSEIARHLTSFADLERDRPDETLGGDEHERMVTAVTDLLLRAGERQPHLLLVDDMQWATPLALDVLRRLITESAPEQLTVMTTYRPSAAIPGDTITERFIELMALPGADSLELGPLTIDDLDELVEDGGHLVAGDELHRQSGGNAFYVAELLRSSGSDDDHRSLLRLVRARAALVHDRAIDYLATAAICGLDFNPSVVAEVLAYEPALGVELTDALIGSGLLLRSERGSRVQFSHGIVADAVLAELGDAARKRLHLDVAAAKRRRGHWGEEVIRHLIGAGPLVEASTLIASATEAAEDLIIRHDSQAAARLMRLVLETDLPVESGVTARRLLGTALLAHSDPSATATLLDAHRTACRLGLDDEILALALAYSHGGAWRNNADPNGARLVRLAIERCPDDRPDTRARLEARLSSLTIFSSSLATRLESTETAVASARATGDPRRVVNALNARLLAIACPALLRETDRLETEILQLEDAGLGRSELSNRPGMATYWGGDGDRYRAEIEARDAFTPNADAAMGVVNAQLATCVAIHDGDLALARTHLARIVPDETSAIDVQKGNHLWNSVMIDWLDGDPTASLPLVQRRYEELRGAPIRYTLLWLAAAHGIDDVTAELREHATSERIARLPELFLGGFGLAGLALAAQVLDDRRLATDVRRELLRLSGQMIGVPWATFPAADHFLGVVDSVLGDYAAAADHFRRAEAVHHRMHALAFDDLRRD